MHRDSKVDKGGRVNVKTGVAGIIMSNGKRTTTWLCAIRPRTLSWFNECTFAPLYSISRRRCRSINRRSTNETRRSEIHQNGSHEFNAIRT